MATNLTAEQKARIELNRKLALEKRAARIAELSNSPVKGLPCNQSSTSNIVLSRNNQFNSHSSSVNNSPHDHEYNNCRGGTVASHFNQTMKPDISIQKQKNNFQGNGKSNYSALDVKVTNTSKKIESNTMSLNIPWPTVSNSAIDTQLKVANPVIGNCKLISKERFTVNIPYQQQTIDLFRTIKGKEYDSKTRLWTFPLSEYFNLKKTLTVLKPHVVVTDLPKCVVETFISKAKHYLQDISKVDISRIDEELRMKIYPFQKEGIQYGVSRGGRCLIADEMGLGKSIQALGIANYYRSDWPLLIVCPSSMRYQWEEEVRVNLPNSVNAHQIFVMTSGKDIVDGATVLILSYDLLAKRRDSLKKMKFGVIILDESQSIKSIKTQRGKAALEMAEQCKRVILLSGTPVLSRPAELHSQIKAVDPKAFPYFKEYGLRYCDGKQNHFGWDFSGSSNMEELGLLLEARFMIRRLKSNVLTQLPSKIRQVVVLHSKSLDKSSQSMDAFAQRMQSSSLKGRERHGCLLSYFAETSKIKASAVCEYITDILQENQKFLCFAHHADMLDAVCNTLEKNKTFYIRIDGSVSAEERKALCDKFQFEDKWMVAVLSIKAANTGLTLTAAQVAIFAELFWNPGDLAQAEDRIHRIGQTDCVVIKYLIAKGTADDYLWPLIQSKLEVLNKAGLSKESCMSADTECVKEKINEGKQRKIDEYFNNPFSEDDDEELLKVMDEVDGVQEKKIKLDY